MRHTLMHVLGMIWRCAGCGQKQPANALAHETAVTGKVEHYCRDCCQQD